MHNFTIFSPLFVVLSVNIHRQNMETTLKQFGNIPITTDVLVSILGDYKAPLQKIMMMERSGELLRIKRGLYVVSPTISGCKISMSLIANHLYPYSYISMQTALREYGLIPERVYTIKSISMRRSKNITTSMGEFIYIGCNPDYYPIGVNIKDCNNYSYMIASPEKALCDLVVFTSGLNLRYLSETRAYIEDDIRMDMDAFAQMDTQIIEQCAMVGKKNTSLLNLIKLIKRL